MPCYFFLLRKFSHTAAPAMNTASTMPKIVFSCIDLSSNLIFDNKKSSVLQRVDDSYLIVYPPKKKIGLPVTRV